MSCTILSKTNSEESILYKQLLAIANNDELLANRYYNSFDTESFIKDFGDYKEDSKLEDKTINQDRVDDNGEPKLFKDKNYNRYYYVNSNQEKVYFPNKSLSNVLTSNSISTIKKSLGAKYIMDNFKLSEGFEKLNFEDTSTTTLSEYLINKLNSKKNYYQNNDKINPILKKIKIARLELLLDHIDELKDEVTDYFKTLKLNYTEDINEIDSLTTKEEDVRDHSYTTSSIERSSKENVNSDIKILLSLIPDINQASFDEILNEPSFYDFNTIYGSLLKVLSNTVSAEDEMLFDSMIVKLEKESQFQPYIKDLLILLDNVSDVTKSKFANAFNLAKNDMFTVEIVKEFEPTTGQIKSYEQKTFSVTELNSKAGTVNNQWNLNFEKLFVHNKAIDKKKYEPVYQKLNKFIVDYNKNVVNKDLSIDSLLSELDPVLDILRSIGVEVTEKGMNYYLRNNLDDYNDVNLVKIQVAGLLNKLQYFSQDLLTGKITDVEKGVLRHENIFKQLAESEAIYVNEGSESSIFAAGKTKWTFSKPSYIKNKIEKFKKNPQLLRNLLNSSKFNTNSRILGYLTGIDLKNYDETDIKQVEAKNKILQERMKNFNVGIFNNLQEANDLRNAVDNGEMSTNDEINMFTNSILGFIKNINPIVRTVTPGDKLNQMFLELPKEIFVKSNYDSDTQEISDSAITIPYNYFIDEYKRMGEVKAQLLSKDNPNLYTHYHLGRKNGLRSQLFPSLSVKFDDKGNVTDIPTIYDFEGNPIILYDNITGFPVLNGFSDRVVEAIKEHIKGIIITNINKTTAELLEIGSVEGVGRTATTNNSIDSVIFDKYREVNEHRLHNIKYQIAADSYINGLISQVEYSKVFAGDYAFYKDMIDYKKRIPSTYTDGQYLNTDEEFFNIAVIESVEGQTPFKNEFNELVKEGVITQEVANYYTKKKINIADAQAWITPARWKFIQNGIGEWGDDHDVVYSKMIGENKEPFTNKELKMLMQPLKGTYFETYSNVPVFLKYSQAVLVPSLIKGTGLQKMYDKMVENPDYNEQIHEVITLDGVKTGALNPTQIHKDEDATEIKDDFTFNKQVLLNSGWKLQQDLPTKGVHDTDVGSQIQKNVFGGLANNLDKIFIYKGEEFTGAQLIVILNDIIGQLSNKGLEKFYRELGINSDGKIENKEMFFNLLADTLITQDGNKNIIQALKSNINPVGVPQAYEKIMNMFSSIALDRIVKIKTNGGSFIQMSDFAIHKDSKETKGIIWTPWSKDKVNSYEILKDEDGNIRRNSEGKPIIKPAGILISGSFIAKYIPDYKKYANNPEKLFGVLNNETGEYEGGMIDYRILNNIIGYRIPNQGLSSNDAFQVVGILPEEMGDTIVAYTGITTKTGSDYDIDKMYMMIPSFRANYNTKGELYKYFRENFKGNTIKETITNLTKYFEDFTELEFNKEQLAEQLNSNETRIEFLKDLNDGLVDLILKNKSNSKSKDIIKELDIKVNKLVYTECLENDLIQLYKSVFTNDNVLNELLTPVDFDHMKNDIIAFREELSKDDTYDFNAYEDIKNKALFKAGKAGVGMLANALVDHIRGRMGNLRFENYNIGAGHIFDGETKFDEEYSTELNNSDLKIYVKLYEEKTGTKLSNSEKENLRKIKISHSLSAVLNGNVDIAKDPFITEGNWNTATTGVGNMLLRAGVHPFHVNAFLRHPILKKYIEFQNNKESKIVSESGNIEDKFKLDLIRTSSEFIDNITINDRTFTYAEFHKLIYGNYLERDFNNLNYSSILNKIKRTQFTNSEGKKGILNKKDIENNQSEIDRFIKTTSSEQIDFLSKLETPPSYFPSFKDLLTLDNDIGFSRQILSVFNILKEDAKKMKKNIDASTQDVRGFGKNSIELITKFNVIKDMLTNSGVGQLVGFKSKLVYNDEYTMLGHYTNNIIRDMMKVVQSNSDLFFTVQPNIINNIDQISIDLKNEKLLDGELGRDIEKGYISYILSGFKGVKTTTEEFKELTSQGFIDKFTEFKKSKGTRYKILEDLDIVKGEKVQFINMSNRTKDSDTQYELTKSWLDMLRNDNEMASDLIKYSFITSSFNMNKGQFYTYIPFEFFIENGINEYLRDIENKPVDINFIEQFYENNYTNGKIVPKFFDNQIAKDDKGVLKFDYRRVTLDIKKSEDVRRYVKYEYKDEEGIKSDRLYKLIGFNPQDQPVYIRVPLKNNRDRFGNQIYQYSTHNTITENLDGLNDAQLKAIDDAYNQLIPLLRDYSKNVEKTGLPEVDEIEKIIIPSKVGDIVTVNFYFEKEDKTFPLKVKIIKMEKFYQGSSTIKDNSGNIIKETKGTPEYFLDLEKMDGSKIYEIAIDESGNITQILGKNGKSFVGGENYISGFIPEVEETIEVETTSTKKVGRVVFEEEKTSGYANRTKKNASADATIAFAIDFNTAGEKLTKSSVLSQNKKYIPININDEIETEELVDNIVNELNSVNAKTLNIAGNGIYTFGKGENVQKNLDDYVYEILKKVIESPNLNTKIESIRSGGQTGIDEAGTKAGIKLGLKTLTLAPKNWTFRNKEGKDISNEVEFKERFGEINKPEQLSLFPELSQEEFNKLTEEERATIEWQKKNCK